MLETYFAKPETVDRIRASWIGSEVERYVGWMADQGYDVRSIWRRVLLLVAFAVGRLFKQSADANTTTGQAGCEAGAHHAAPMTVRNQGKPKAKSAVPAAMATYCLPSIA